MGTSVFLDIIFFSLSGAHANLDYEQSLFFSLSVEQNARDTQMTTRVTKGARRERPCFSRLAASPLNACARVHSLN